MSEDARTRVRVRTKHGGTFFRAGLKWIGDWTVADLTSAQLAAVNAEAILAVQELGASSEFLPEPTDDGTYSKSQVDALIAERQSAHEAEVARLSASIAGLEAQLAGMPAKRPPGRPPKAAPVPDEG